MSSHGPLTFAECRAALLEKGESLKRLLDTAEEQSLEMAALSDLRHNRFSVAVIGEIKAGKSTFLNALIGRPGFLPTDVNPWTAVITQLHFGRPGGPTQGAEFTFFTNEEWQALVKHTDWREAVNKKTGCLVQPLAGTDDAEGAEWESQQKTFARNLASQFGQDEVRTLLGTKRTLSEVHSCALEDYLTDGGRYASITKEAELFLPQAPDPFEGHFTIVDTPGTNDPCRVREERTLHYLDRADAYVLVVRATAALSAAIAELLHRVIVGLHKGRLLVFVNGIDNLGSPEVEVDHVRNYIARSLKKLFPSVEIPVLAGSARWAGLALGQNPGGWLRDFRWGSFEAYGCGKGWFTEEAVRRGQREAEAGAPRPILQAIWKASGIPEIRAAIQSTLLREKGQALLEKARRELQRRAEAHAASHASKAAECEQTAGTLEKGAADARRQLAELRQRKEELDERLRRLREVRSREEQKLAEMVKSIIKHIRGKLREVVDQFADEQRRQLEKKDDLIFGPEFKALLRSCQADLEGCFLRAYRNASDAFHCEQTKLLHVLRHELEEVDYNLAQQIKFVQPSEVNPAPALSGIRKCVSVEFDLFYRVLGKYFEGKKARARTLHGAILGEFEEPVKSLVSSAREEFERALHGTLQQLGWAVEQVTQHLESRLRQDIRLYEEIERTHDPQKVKQTIQEAKRLATWHRTSSTALSKLGQEIAAVPVP